MSDQPSSNRPVRGSSRPDSAQTGNTHAKAMSVSGIVACLLYRVTECVGGIRSFVAGLGRLHFGRSRLGPQPSPSICPDWVGRSIRKSVVKRTFQQWYEFSVTSRLLGQQLPQPLLRRCIIQPFHRAVRMCDACTAVVTGQAAFGSVVDLHAQLAEQHVSRFHPVNIAVGDLDDNHGRFGIEAGRNAARSGLEDHWACRADRRSA